MGGLPINPVLQGLLQGIQTGLQIRQQQMAQEAFELRKAEFERQRMLDDLRSQAELTEIARPVEGGMVADVGTGKIDYNAIPGSSRMTELMGGLYGGREYEVPISRKARSTVTYRTAKGQEREYELMTPEERQARSIRFGKQEAQAKAEMERQAEEGMLPIRARRAAGEARGRAKGEAEAIRETGTPVDLSELIPGATGQIYIPAKGGAAAYQSIMRLLGLATQGETQRDVATIRKEGTVEAAGKRAEGSVKAAGLRAGATVEAARTRAGGGGAGLSGADKLRARRLQNKIDDLDAKEQAIWTRVAVIKDKLARGAYSKEVLDDPANNPKKVISDLEAKAKELDAQEKTFLAEKEKLYGRGSAAEKPQGGGPKAGETRQYQGFTYRFNGKVWERQ